MQSLNISSAVKSPSPKSLSNDALLQNTQALVTEERKLTNEILWHLHEIQERRLYAEKGYASLFEYAVQALRYSEAAAGRRIAAMRLLVDVPEIENALQQGEITLSTLSTVQSFIQRKNSNRDGKPVSKAEKKELVLSLQGKSKRECEKALFELDPAAALPKERERVASATQTEIRFVADDELMQKLQSIKELDSHVLSNPSYLKLFHRIADIALKELDPLSKTKRATSTTPNHTLNASKHSLPTSKIASALKPENVGSSNTPGTAHSCDSDISHSSDSSNANHSQPMTPPAELKKTANPRYVPAAIRREIWKRDQGRCAYKSPEGMRCTSRFALQIDHITPIAWDGKNEPSNLQLLCREHNRLKAVAQIGPTVMSRYMRL
jgi:5-methylcytosine-specific restriction endonuclease McrA